MEALLNLHVKWFHSVVFPYNMVSSAYFTDSAADSKTHCFFPLTVFCRGCVFSSQGNNLKSFPELSTSTYSRQLPPTYLVGGFLWDPRPGPALLHSVSESGWCSRPLPPGGSAPLLNWLLSVCLPLYVSAACMTAEWERKTRWVTLCKHAFLQPDSFERVTAQEKSTPSLRHMRLWSAHSLGSL